MDKQTKSIYRIGAVVSIIQSFLFVTIATIALLLNANRYVAGGFSSLRQDNFQLFLLLCGAFVLIAILGLAITPAEKEIIRDPNAGLAAWGSNLAYFGHMGTIAFFGWWIIFAISSGNGTTNSQLIDSLMPIRLGIIFPLGFVGLWLWIIAYNTFKYNVLPKGLGIMSIVKAVCFWSTIVAFFANVKIYILLTMGLTCLFAGPIWHIWIARLFIQRAKKKIE
jgi:hypothetical protein